MLHTQESKQVADKNQTHLDYFNSIMLTKNSLAHYKLGITKELISSLASYCYNKKSFINESYGKNLEDTHETLLFLAFDFLIDYITNYVNAEQIILYILAAANKGSVKAQWLLGYLISLITENDKELIAVYYPWMIFYYDLAAKQNCAAASAELGICYDLGKGVQPDKAKAMYYFQLASNQKHPQGQLWLGRCYFHGEGVDKNLDKAVELIKLAADQNLSQALFEMGVLYIQGQIVNQNFDIAANYLTTASDLGHIKAPAELVNLYNQTNFKKIDPRQIVKYLTIGSTRGDAIAQYLLGLAYLNGHYNVKQNLETAINYFQDAEKQGYPAALYELGLLYLRGVIANQKIILKQDNKKALIFFLSASNSRYAQASYQLYLLYLNYPQIKNYIEKALLYLIQSSDDGFPKAQYDLGLRFYKGDGVKQDLERALTLIKSAADQGLAEAQFEIGDRYLREKDYTNAIPYFEKAATQNYSQANEELAIAYYQLGCQYLQEKNHLALDYFHKSAKLNYQRALHKLINCNEQGELCEKNLAKALSWYHELIQVDPNYKLDLSKELLEFEKNQSNTQQNSQDTTINNTHWFIKVSLQRKSPRFFSNSANNPIANNNINSLNLATAKLQNNEINENEALKLHHNTQTATALSIKPLSLESLQFEKQQMQHNTAPSQENTEQLSEQIATMTLSGQKTL